MKYLLWLALGLAGISGCASRDSSMATPTLAVDTQAITSLYANWRTAVGQGNIPGYLRALDPQVKLMPPGAAAIEGAKTYAAFLEPVFESATYDIEVVKPPTVEILGDLALAEYEYVIHLDLKNPTQGVAEPGALTASRSQLQYFDVLRRQADGSWGVWRHTWRDSVPQ